MILRRLALSVLIASSALSIAWAADSDPVKMSLQELGIQVKQAADRNDVGTAPSSVELARLTHQLTSLRTGVRGSAVEGLAAKYRSIAALLESLKHNVGSQRQSIRTQPLPADIDVERVTDLHGSHCANALGLSAHHPVVLTLGAGGDVWLHFESTDFRPVRVATDAYGLDPLLEIFSDCGASTPPITRNDDAIGIDAATVFTPPRGMTYVHVVNTAGSGQVKTSIEALADFGTITGQLTDALTGNPLPYQSVVAVCADSDYCGAFSNTDGTGQFSIPVQPGTYYVEAEADEYVYQVYPSAYCLSHQFAATVDSCDVAHATSIDVSTGATIANIDLALSRGHSISGDVRDSSNVPVSIPSVTVSLMDTSGSILDTTYQDAAGHYTFAALADSVYKVEAQAQGYGSQLYKNVACTGIQQTDCDPAHATPINVAGADFSGADFHLPPLAAFQGQVIGINGIPLSDANVDVYGANGLLVTQGYADSLGYYRTGSVLPGNYYVTASAGYYFAQLYAGYDCTSLCSQNLAHGTLLPISNAMQQVSLNFQLNPLPVLAGHVQDAVTGSPLPGVIVQAGITPSLSTLFNSQATTDTAGNFSFAELGAGTYYLWARSVDHVDQIYSGLPCETSDSYIPIYLPCNIVGANLVTIASGVAPIAPTFSLQPSATIHGHVSTQTGTAYDLPASAGIDVYDTAGTPYRHADTDALGNYVVTDLPPGTFFVVAGSGLGTQFVSQLWQDMACASPCLPTTGTPITVSNGQEIDNIDFSLARIDAVVGRVTDEAGVPITGTIVDLFDSADNSYQQSAVVDSQGYYVAAASTEVSYFVATEAGDAYTDQIYSGIECPMGAAYYGACPFAGATPVALNPISSQPHIVNFVLKQNNEIFGNGFE